MTSRGPPRAPHQTEDEMQEAVDLGNGIVFARVRETVWGA
jgi:hypothetical protein